MTLTDVISKVIRYAKRVIVNDNSSSAAVAVNQSGSGDGVLITQTGTGNAIRVEDSTNPDATPFIVNADGKVLCGTTSYIDVWNTAQNVILAGTGNSGIGIVSASESTAPPVISFSKSRGTNTNAFVRVQNEDVLGTINFAGGDGSNNIPGARINAVVDNTPGTADMPCRLDFLTTENGSANPQLRMRISNTGNVGINVSSPTATLHTSGKVRFSSLPTSSAGLVGGDIWNDGGTLKIV
jgi:hypothetical protein